MTWLIIIVIALILWLIMPIRIMVFHPILTTYYAVTDLFNYFRYCKWRLAPYGELIAFNAYFGGGKTLNAVHLVALWYRKFNNKKVWCSRRKKWVTQKIVIYSNVAFKTIPYIKFESLKQIVQLTKVAQEVDDQQDTLTVYYVLGDEFSTQLNSRNFKTNIDGMFLNSLLTCRHYRLSIIYTSQRFKHVDALIRQVTQSARACKKWWRCITLNYYDAWDLENAANLEMVKPIKRIGWFIRNKDFNEYDTMAVVQDFQKSYETNDFISSQEILSNIAASSDTDGVMHLKGSFKRRKKKGL